MPAPLVGMVFQYLHNEAGHPAFLVGQTSQTGWWYYFPLALVCKSTPSELLLFGLLLIAAWHFSRATWKKVSQIQFRAEITAARGAANWPLDQLLLWTALLVYGFLMLNVRVQIGHRYLLPIYPMVCLLAIDWLGSWWQERRWRAIVTIGVLLSVQLFSVVGIAPHYLAYFSPFVGGSTRRHPTGSCK